jgi:hypothetical protein
MKRYNIFLYAGILMVSFTYLLIFLIPGKELINLFSYNHYFGIIPRIFPVLLIFGDIFMVVGLLFPALNIKKQRMYLAIVSFIFIIAGISTALAFHASPLNMLLYNGIRAGYLIIEGFVLLFFTMVMAHYISVAPDYADAKIL